MASNETDITVGELVAAIVVGVLIFILLVLQIALLIYIFCRKKRCLCFKDKERDASRLTQEGGSTTTTTCCPIRGKARGSVASDEYDLIREASIHSETSVKPVIVDVVETSPVDPEVRRKRKRKKNDKHDRGLGEGHDDVTGERTDPADTAKKLEAILTPGTEKDQQPRVQEGSPDTAPRGKELEHLQTQGDPAAVKELSEGGKREPNTRVGLTDSALVGGKRQRKRKHRAVPSGDDHGRGETGTRAGPVGTDPGPEGSDSRGVEMEDPLCRDGHDLHHTGGPEDEGQMKVLSSRYTLPGQAEEGPISREEPFIRGRGQPTRPPIDQYTRPMPDNLPRFSLPPIGVIGAWNQRSGRKVENHDSVKKTGSTEVSPEEDLGYHGYSESSRRTSSEDEPGGEGQRDSNSDGHGDDKWGRGQHGKGGSHRGEFRGESGTLDEEKKSKMKMNGIPGKSDGSGVSRDTRKMPDGQTRECASGRDPHVRHDDGNRGSDSTSRPGRSDMDSRPGEGTQMIQSGEGRRSRGTPGVGSDTTTRNSERTRQPRVTRGTDGDSGIVDLGRADGESSTDPEVKTSTNQGGFYVAADQHSVYDDVYRFWPDRVGRYRGMDQYDSEDSEMVPEDLYVEDAEFDNDNHLLRSHIENDLESTKPSQHKPENVIPGQSNVQRVEQGTPGRRMQPQANERMSSDGSRGKLPQNRQRLAVNLGRGIPSDVIIEADEELLGEGEKTSGNRQQIPANTSKKRSGSEKDKRHPAEKNQDLTGHEADGHGEKRDRKRPRDSPADAARGRHLRLRSSGAPRFPGPYSDSDSPRQGTSGRGTPGDPLTVNRIAETRRKRRRWRRRDTERSDRRLAAEDDHSWNAYLNHDNYLELPPPLTVIFFDSDDDLR